jgi:hypothetical protein
VRAREEADAQDVHVFLDCGVYDLLGGAVEAGIDDIDARVAKTPCDHPDAAVVTVQTDLCQQYSNVLAHPALLRSAAWQTRGIASSYFVSETFRSPPASIRTRNRQCEFVQFVRASRVFAVHDWYEEWWRPLGFYTRGTTFSPRDQRDLDDARAPLLADVKKAGARAVVFNQASLSEEHAAFQ